MSIFYSGINASATSNFSSVNINNLSVTTASLNNVSVTGNLSVTGSFADIVNTEPAGAVNIGNGQTTGTIDIGTGARTGSGTINIGTGSSRSAAINIGTGGEGNVNIGSATANVSMLGTVTTGNLTVTGPTASIVNTESAGAVNIGNAQTTGTIDIGTGARTGTGTINIGTGSSRSAIISIGTGGGTGNVNIGSAAANVSMLGTVTTGNLTVTGPTASIVNTELAGAVNIGNGQTTGTIDIGTGARTGSGTINIGTGSSRSAAINIGTGGEGNVNIGSATANVSMLGTVTTGNLTVTGPTASIVNTESAGAVNIGNAQTTGTIDIGTGARTGTGTINIGTGSSRSAIISIGTGGGTGNVNIGSAAANVSMLGTVTTGNLTVTGPTASIVNTELAGAVNIGNAQTTGTIDIGTAATRSGRINIGTGGTETFPIGIGNINSKINISGTTNVSGTVTASGLITGNNGITVPAGQTIAANGGLTVTTITASGLITGSAGITVPAGQTIAANGGLTATTITASGLITGSAGITVPAGQTIAANGGITTTNVALNQINGINLITENNNFAYGQGGLPRATIGGANTAFGLNTLLSNTSGSNNLAIGGRAMQSNTSGSDNIAIGLWALLNNREAISNIAIGKLTERFIEHPQSNYNIAIGHESITTTNASKTDRVINSIAIGTQSNCNNYSNSIALGVSATCTAANQIMLGRSSETVVIPGNFSSKNASFVNVSIMNLTVNGNFSAINAYIQNVSGINASYINVSSSNFSAINAYIQNVSGINASFTNVSVTNMNTTSLYYNASTPYVNMATILGDTNENLGYSCALNAAGNILAVGSPYFDDEIENKGKLQIYQYVNSTWGYMTTILGETSEQLGYSCALNAAGNILAVGSPTFTSNEITNRGKLQIFQYINSTWQNMSTILGSSSEELGYSCALNAAGNILVVGSPSHSRVLSGPPYSLAKIGKIQIFQYINSIWQNTKTIFGQHYIECLGTSCALNAAGNILAVGAPFFDDEIDLETTKNNSGRLQIFQYINSIWQNTKTIIGEFATIQLGISCALNAAGNILAVGSQGFDMTENQNRGRLEIYQYTNSDWQIMKTILGSESEQLGYSCALNAAGNILAVGINYNPGKLEIHEYKNLTWKKILTISGPGESLGYSCALNAAGNIFAVGSQDFTNGEFLSAGKLQVFQSQAANLNMDAGTDSGSLQTITIGKTAYSTTIGYPGSQFTVNTNINTSSINNATIVFDTLNSNAAMFNGKFGTGDGNTALGTYAMYLNASGNNNTAVGAFALKVNASGNNNTALGMYALTNTSGNNNTAIGTYADQYTQNTNASNNTAIGYQAYTANNNTSLNPVVNSTAIGANSTTNGFSNSTAIGYNASSTAANQIMLGTIEETVVMPGNFSMPSTAYMNVFNASFTNVSLNKLTSTELITTPSVESIEETSNLAIGTRQTSGIINIGTGSTRDNNGAINIGTGGSAAFAIGIGNSTSITTNNGTFISSGLITANGGLTVESGDTLTTNKIETNTAKSDLAIGLTQTSGNINIGTGTTRNSEGNINIGTGGSAAFDIGIGNSTSITTNNGRFISSGLITANGGLTVESGDTLTTNKIETNTATSNLAIGTRQTSGIINIGTGSTRDNNGAINIGTGGSAAFAIGIGNSTSITTNNGTFISSGLITANGGLTVESGDTLTTNKIETNTAKSDLAIGLTQTSGNINIGTGTTRNSEGNINIGTGGSAAFDIGIGNSTSITTNNGTFISSGLITANGGINIYEAEGTGNSTTVAKGSLVIEHGNSGGASSIIFPSCMNRATDYGYIRYRDNLTNNGTGGESARFEIGIENDSDDHLVLQKNNGFVGVGQINPAYKLDVTGDGRFTGTLNSGIFNSTSDIRVKNIIRYITIDETLNFINNTNPILFKWKDNSSNIVAGYIAQEVIKTQADHLVYISENSNMKESDDGPEGIQYTLNYDGIIPYHGVAIKHLLQENKDLKEEIKDLSKKNDDLSKKNDDLSNKIDKIAIEMIELKEIIKKFN
jgi:hypothetical protein